MTVLAYVTDLFLEARILQTAQSVGARVKVVSTIYKFLPELASDPEMVIVDLTASGISPSSLIAQIKARQPELRVLACGPHGQTRLLEEARKAGADSVLASSEFCRTLKKILAGE